MQPVVIAAEHGSTDLSIGEALDPDRLICRHVLDAGKALVHIVIAQAVLLAELFTTAGRE